MRRMLAVALAGALALGGVPAGFPAGVDAPTSRTRASVPTPSAATTARSDASPSDASPAAGPAASGLRTDNIRDMEYWLDDYGIRQAWKTTRGRGQTIAIIDSGVDGSHPDLAGAVVGGADFSGLGSANGQKPVGTGEDAWHGTLVGSLAAGRGTAGTDGVIGAAPEASLLSLSIGYEQGSTPSDTQIARAVRWAVDNGATVINMSLTRNTPDWPTSWDEAFLYAEQRNVVVVAAAGNRGSGTEQVGAPATMPGVVAVGGVARDGTASRDASSQGITIAVSAPSEQLVGDIPGGRYATWSGTSGAAPIVSGIVALIRAANPGLDAANVIQRLIATARDAGPAGQDFSYGYGLVDAAAAVGPSVPTVSANPLGTLKQWIATYRPGTTAAGAPGPAPHSPARRSDPPWSPVGVLLPSPTALVLYGLPALVLAGIIAAWTAFSAVAIGAVRRRRRSG